MHTCSSCHLVNAQSPINIFVINVRRRALSCNFPSNAVLLLFRETSHKVRGYHGLHHPNHLPTATMHHPTKAHPKRVSVSISISGALFVCLLLHTITLCTARRGLTPTKMNAALTVSSSALSRSLAQSAPAASLNQGFVTVQNTTFSLNDRPWFCAGSNAFYAAIVDRLTEDQVWELFKVHASQNATVVRVFAHSDGYGLPGQMSVSHPIQPQLGQYDETALQRLDLVLQAAGANGIRLILPLTNFEPFLGGMQW